MTSSSVPVAPTPGAIPACAGTGPGLALRASCLETGATAAWRLSLTARRDDNYGRAVDAMNRLKPYLKSPYPKLRRIARGFWRPPAANGGSGEAA